MAEVRSQQPQHVQVHASSAHTPQQYRYYQGGAKTQHHGGEGGGVMSLFPEISLTGSQLLALLAGVPLGGMLLLLSGVSLIASLVGLAVATPLFIFFSPVLVPAAFAIGMAVTAVLAAGACGLVGLVSFSWLVNCLRQMPRGTTTKTTMMRPEQAKRHVADMAEYVGKKTKDVGQDIQTRAHAQGTTGMV
ncbi:hypothetical protein JHK87_051974 [Glycine soja]|nr:hypothetical protein JHK87_051974 [Glycine soja]